MEIDPQLQQLIDAVEDSMDCDAWGYHGHDQNNAQRKAIAEAVNARLLPEDARDRIKAVTETFDDRDWWYRHDQCVDKILAALAATTSDGERGN